MTEFLIYQGKAGIALAVFYMFYRLMLSKETFHRFNRIVLIATSALAFALPFCVITIRKTVILGGMQTATAGLLNEGTEAAARLGSTPIWPIIMCSIFAIGASAVLVNIAVSIIRIKGIISSGTRQALDSGEILIITENDTAPFSWMKYIVISREDYENGCEQILTHEKAHIGLRHSCDILFVDMITALQWFNPAIWMLKADLRALHEFEADDAVLRSGANIKEYQYLLIKKAVGKSGYSVANSLNHSILKKRITMMSKSKSPLLRGLRLMYVLPLVCLCIGLQARTVYIPADKSNENSAESVAEQASPLYILRYAWGEEKEITKAELDKIEPSRISAIEILKDSAAKEKYGERSANGVFIIKMKVPQEMDQLTVVSYTEKGEAVPFYLVEPDTMPSFQGKGMQGFSSWLFSQIRRPKGCKHTGTMKVSFVIAKDGSVKDVHVQDSVCEELDNLVVSVIQKSPKWEPATLGGKPVEQCLKLPIAFQMR